MSGHKRAAESQLSRDDDYDRDDREREEFITTPQIADADELATRRIITVKRTLPSTAAAASSTPSTGFFANVAGVPAPAPTSGFSFGTTAAKPGEAASAKAPAGFSFGSGAPFVSAFGAKKEEAGGAAEAPKFSFSFGAPASSAPDAKKNEAGDAAENKPTEAPKFNFSFGAPASNAPDAKKDEAGGAAEAPKFSFNFGTPAAPFTFGTGAQKSATDDGVKPSGATFGSAGAFSFTAAVSSFKEAQQKLMEQQSANPTSTDTAGANGEGAEGSDDGEDAPKLFAGKSAIATVSGEALASGPSKLYIFEKEGNRWKEHGEGEAKVKRDVVPAEDGKEGAKEETIYRLMVRDGYSLTAALAKSSFVLSKEAEKHIIFSTPTENGVGTYLLKFTGPSGEANAAKIVEEIKKALAGSEASA